MATSDVTMKLLDEVERIRPVIQDNAASAEANGQLSSAAYDAMHEAGLFAMLAPNAHGGLELHPVEAMRVWEAVARIDSAAAWNLVMNQAIAAYAAWLPAGGAQELFRDGPPTVAGALNPPAAATRVEGGWRIMGQCPFGSGCHNAEWRGSRRRSGYSSRAPPPRFSTRGTPWACAARARPTMRCRTSSCPIA
jgi:alkylation response protein AidB-like acyl-CoA dehydrogenase